MSLVLANTTSLWKEISTNPMQRPLYLPHPIPEPQWLDSWHCFDHCSPHSSLLLILTTFPYGCLHLFISSSTIYHSRKDTVPRVETITYNVQFCPSAGSSRCNQQRAAIISSWQGEGDLPQTCFQLSAEPWEICWPPQEPVWGWKGTAEIHHVHCSLPLFILLVAALDAGKEIECINCFTWVYSAPLLSEVKSHGVSEGWGWVQH